MPVEKFYELNGYKLRVLFDRQLVKIYEPLALRKYLSKDISERSTVFVNAIKTDYLLLFDQELEIHADSMIVEIWGHVYASYFAKAMKNLIQLNLLTEIADGIISRSDTIDCGEIEIDQNRKFWDILANFKGMILTFLPKRIKAK